MNPLTTVADVDGKALYLLAMDDAPALQYTAGKLLITLRGYDESAGF